MITYASIAEKLTMSPNLRLLNVTDHHSIRFSDDFNHDQMNDKNTDTTFRYYVRRSPSKKTLASSNSNKKNN